MKSIFRSRRNRIPRKQESRKENPFFRKTTQDEPSPFFSASTKSPLASAQPKLKVGQPGDKYEQEADSVAQRVVNDQSPSTVVQRQEISSIQRVTLATPAEDERLGTAEARMEKDKLIQEKPDIQRESAPKDEDAQMKQEDEDVQMKQEDEDVQMKQEDEDVQMKQEDEDVQMKSVSNGSTASPQISTRIKDSAGKGSPLSRGVRTEMEHAFGFDFSGVHVHTDTNAADMNKALRAQAFTHGRDVFFNTGKYNPNSHTGKELLAHELTHVVQQSGKGPHTLQKKEPAQTATATRINYSRARRLNKAYAKRNRLGWAYKLGNVAKGAYKEWEMLWKQRKYNEFANKVADYQRSKGIGVDGVLGLKSWGALAGLGEMMAGIIRVRGRANQVCTLATKYRFMRAHKLLNKPFELAEGKNWDTFNVILQSIPSRMKDIDQQYRGAGAAGVLVYSGLGSFVSESDIWNGGLKPGAAIQVWGRKKAYDLLRAGVIKRGKRTRRLRESDTNFYGTSMVFVRYDHRKPDKRMWVRHFGKTELVRKSEFKKWVAANVNE